MRRAACFVFAAFMVILMSCRPDTTAEGTLPPPAPASSASPSKPVFELSLALSAKFFERYENMARNVMERTDNAVRITVFPNGRLGTDIEIMRSVQRGSLSMAAASASTYLELVPEAAVMCIPACFDEYIKEGAVYNGRVKELLGACYNNAGFELLALEAGSNRVLSGSVPLRSLEDIAGLKIRTLDSPYYLQFWRELGAEPVSDISFRDLYQALVEGSVQAQENSYPAILSANLDEVQPYVMDGPFFASGTSLVINKQIWDNLPEQYRQIISEEAQGTTGSVTEIQRLNEIYVKQIQSHVDIYTMTEAEIEQLRQYAQPVLEAVKNAVGEELLEALRIEASEGNVG